MTRSAALAFGVALLSVISTSVYMPASTETYARTKPGPVTLRGIAEGVTAQRFSLGTATRGTYTVLVSSATVLKEKGVRDRISLHDGDHVGVRGFVHGNQMRAMSVRVYPVKPRPYSVNGTVSAVHTGTISIRAVKGPVLIYLTASTAIAAPVGAGGKAVIRVGDRIDARVQSVAGRAVAIHIRVTHPLVPLHRVQVRGVVRSISGHTLVVVIGRSIEPITVTASTIWYLGSARAGPSAARAGSQVDVHACCAGRALVATSVHVRVVRTVVTTFLIHGTVVSISATHVRVRTSTGLQDIGLDHTTRFELGSATIGRQGVEVYDAVSVRARHVPGGTVADRVHVEALSRKLHTVSGSVQAVRRGGLLVSGSRGRYTVRLDAHTAVLEGSRRVSIAAITSGERVRAVGRLVDATTLLATGVTVMPRVVAARTVRGTITQISGGTMTIVETTGAVHHVSLSPGVHPLWRGHSAPASVLFPGVHAVARVHGRVASGVTISVGTRTISGRLERIFSGRLLVGAAAGTTLAVLVPDSVRVLDGHATLQPRALHLGVFLKITAYHVAPQPLRAYAIVVLHPARTLSGTVVSIAPELVVRDSHGEQYVLRIASGTVISGGRIAVQLHPSDLTTGTLLHVTGTMGSDGRLTTSTITVRLHSTIVRSLVTGVLTNGLTLDYNGGSLRIRLMPSATVTQGSHPLTLRDVVRGDDVSISGYLLGHGQMMARHIIVHRRLVPLDGTISAADAYGFTLTTLAGDVRVLLSDATVLSGGVQSDLASGLPVHVTGYRRGDGVILATRVRIKRH